MLAWHDPSEQFNGFGRLWTPGPYVFETFRVWITWTFAPSNETGSMDSPPEGLSFDLRLYKDTEIVIIKWSACDLQWVTA